MMSLETYDALMIAMVVLAVVVFVALYFVKAGYGMFRSGEWGWSIDNKAGWVMMEAPAFFVMAGVAVDCDAFVFGKEQICMAPSWVLMALFLLHYFQRSFVFPLKMNGKGRMPVAIMLMGVTFNVINALLIGGGLFWFPDAVVMHLWHGELLQMDLSRWLLQPTVMLGIVVFFVGMGINLHSDHVIRHLRKPGDTNHYLPEKGMYRYVTSANYFGELVEWTGFAIASMTPAAWVFVWWTAANLVPRAHAIHKRYRQEFGSAVGSRKRIIPFVY